MLVHHKFKIYSLEFSYTSEHRPAKIENGIRSAESYTYTIYFQKYKIFSAGDNKPMSTLRIVNQFKKYLKIKGNSTNKYVIESEEETLKSHINLYAGKSIFK